MYTHNTFPDLAAAERAGLSCNRKSCRNQYRDVLIIVLRLDDVALPIQAMP